jgi:hypothetical protein
MKRKKREPSMDMTDIGLDEALARLAQTSPKELEETLAKSMLERDERINARIRNTRQEIEDGGRPREGRFRL